MKNTTTIKTATATAKDYEIKQARVFVAKFLPCTNTRGARVRITHETQPLDKKQKKSFTYAWDYEAGAETYEKAFLIFLGLYEDFFFDRQAGERFEIFKSWSPKGYYFTARVAR